MEKIAIHKLPFLEVNRNIFILLKEGVKKIETRAGSTEYFKIHEGDQIEFSCGEDKIMKVVKKVYQYRNFDELFSKYKPQEINPEIFSVDEMKKQYLSFPGYEQRIQKYGILVFRLE